MNKTARGCAANLLMVEYRTAEEDAALDLMVWLIQDYEEEHHSLPEPSPQEMLVYLMVPLQRLCIGRDQRETGHQQSAREGAWAFL